MKKRGLFLLFLFLFLFIIFSRYNNATRNFLLDLINPIKIKYTQVFSKIQSFLKRDEEISKYQNKIVKLQTKVAYLSFYMNQLSILCKDLPSLEKKPYKNIYLVNTISYVKLNKYNEIMLTKPNTTLKKDHLYGLIQGENAAGVAKLENGKLYGYLLSNPKCTFSVKIGNNEIPGLAQGDGSKSIIIKFIPRWSQIKVGDEVKTSGLDNIFFPNIPVGQITQIQTLDRYKEAKVKVYANLLKPKLFFLIADATPYITTNYEPNTSFPGKVYPFIPLKQVQNKPASATQTQAEPITPTPLKEQDYLQLYNYFWQNDLFDNNFSLQKEDE